MIPAWFIWTAIGLGGLATVLALVRAYVGPTTFDRLAAIDNMTVIVTSFILIMALFFGSNIYIDVALVYAILSFVGVIVFSRLLEGGL